MNPTVVLLLDFDGCVSPDVWTPERMPDTWPDWTHVETHTLLSPLMLAALERLPATIATASSRGDDMAHLINPHLTDTPMIACPDGYKLDELDTFIAAHQPARVVWIDDDLAWQPNRQRIIQHRPGFLLRPDPLIGITPDDITAIHTWLTAPAPVGDVLIDRR